MNVIFATAVVVGKFHPFLSPQVEKYFYAPFVLYDLFVFILEFKNKIRFTAQVLKNQTKHNFREGTSENNFVVENYQGIKFIQMMLPLSSPWIFLTGDNGFGKTNILQALARVLSNSNDNLSYEAIKPLGKDTKLSIMIHGNWRIVSPFEKTSTNSSFRVMGYGAGRLDMGSDRNTKEYRPASSLFETQVLLKNIEREGLSRWYFKSKDRAKFDHCVCIFKQLLPSLHDIYVDDDSAVWYVEKDDCGNILPEVQFKDLATGYQNIISMVGDIILQLNMPPDNYEHQNLRKHMQAIVLIDEIELYLHPKWQKKLPGMLTRLFPNILFIASTHSPIPLLGAPEGSAFFRVNRSSEKGITMTRLDENIFISELLPNTVLSSPIFGMEDIFSTNYKGEKPSRLENIYNEVVLNDIIDRKVSDFLTDRKEQELIQRYNLRRSNSLKCK